ncbi:alpha/beta hydrolase [Marinilongibacter aquaticus]|uniref:alpha/beta hydrolase n=1 Tax=Marinilongibacter aquaticus TaxID=2975157 RepID=UPI0021BD4389|nr:alpha/beta fold hydrolase [Marinilongibacter aquaticus]UBM59333.1 alpha/beta hydrolase [Marinilongibacter aquaticus]
MKKFLYGLIACIALLALVYFMGPQPKEADLSKNYTFEIPDRAEGLTQYVLQHERHIKGLKAGNEAQIVWADSLKEKTEYAFVYLHGFSASHEEGAPVHENLAKQFHANLYKARLFAHGIDRGDSTMIDFNADDYIQSGEEALAIGKKLGKKVVLIGTSAGGAMSLFLASRHPEITALVLYSPCIEIYDPNAKMLDDPWGLQIARTILGSDTRHLEGKSPEEAKYWALNYRIESLVGLQNFLTPTMTKANFEKIKCPVFMGYYYRDEEHQDMVVSVKAELRMFDELGSETKEKMAFPNANAHVLASHVVSGSVARVESETAKFLHKVIP